MGTVNRAEVVGAIEAASRAWDAKGDVFFKAHAVRSANKCLFIADALDSLGTEVNCATDDDRAMRAFDHALADARRDAAAFRKLGATADAHECDAVARAVVGVANSLGIEMEGDHE